MASPDSVHVPVRGFEEVVEIRKDALPSDAEEILDLLRAEAAPLSLWLEVANAYLASGSQAGYEKVLTAAVSDETQRGFQAEGIDIREERVLCLCALGSFYIQEGLASQARGEDKTVRTGHQIKANNLFTAALRMGRAVLPALGQGQLALSRVSEMP